MKEVTSVRDYEKVMLEYALKDDCEFIVSDLAKFVGDEEFVIYLTALDQDVHSEDNIISIGNKLYFMVERYEGIRFVGIDDENTEWFNLHGIK